MRTNVKESIYNMNIGLLGFGTVGRGFYELAENSPDIKITAVLSRRPRPELKCLVTDNFEELLASGVDMVVEAIGGVHPAYEYAAAALRAGKHFVTANKQLICEYYDELTGLAGQAGPALRCTAAAGGGIPWLSSLARTKAMDRIYKVEGIMNGTSNFILDAMTKNGTDYADALKEAQALGYAEADPTADVEGFDAARKLVISANLAFDAHLKFEDVICKGISSITAADIAAWKVQGKVCKLIASAEINPDGSIKASVEPKLFAADSLEAGVDKNNNFISLYAEKIGKQSFFGQGAGAYPTGSNVLADCLAIAGGARGFY